MLRSKAQSTVEDLGEDFCMIGICNERFVAMEVEKMEPILPQMRNAVQTMRKQHIGVSW